jgi:hypothetical protein
MQHYPGAIQRKRQNGKRKRKNVNKNKRLKRQAGQRFKREQGKSERKKKDLDETSGEKGGVHALAIGLV